MASKLWIKFETMEDYNRMEKTMYEALADSDGHDSVVIYVAETRQKKVLPPNRNVKADSMLIEKLAQIFGADNVKVQ